jgi:mRNA interferase RelE/StbE
MIYEVKIRRKAFKSLSRIPDPYRSNIIKAIKGLATNQHPPQSKKLTGRDAWRIRIGNYRAIYEIIDDELVILVLNVANRKDIYK